MNAVNSSQTSNLTNLMQLLEDRVFSRKEIMTLLYDGLREHFGFSTVNIYLFDPVSSSIEETYPKEAWNLPSKEKDWFLDATRRTLLKHKSTQQLCYYTKDRSDEVFTDTDQLKKDQATFGYNCSDFLMIPLTSEEDIILGGIIIHHWDKKEPVFITNKAFEAAKVSLKPFIKTTCTALDNLHIHKKIESLLSDKHQLKKRIQKDEEDLKRRVLELTSLYDSSTALGNALNYQQIIDLIIDSLVKTLEFDLCSIFLKDLIPNGGIVSRVNIPLTEGSVKAAHMNLLNAIKPFIKTSYDYETLDVTVDRNYTASNVKLKPQPIKSFANVPLIFKEEVIGMINLCSKSSNAFPKSEMPFIHTMANQLASNLGRIKIIRELENSKITSLIECMDDGVLFIDEHHRLKIINPTTQEIFHNGITIPEAKENIRPILKTYGLLNLYTSVIKSKKPKLNQNFTLFGKSFSVNISPVLNEEVGSMGIVIVFRDITEIEKISRIKSQRLEVISKVNLILKSITDLGNLLTVLMEFILNVANGEMGSIQLKQGNVFFSKIHSNFPDKIRRFYKFTNGMTISEHVIKTKEICYIEDYKNNTHVNQHVKIFIDAYLCIPIMAKNELIGVVNIARKSGNSFPSLTEDDINTLSTITTLSGTAIQNAILYQETISRQKLDQELKIATQIQTKLLPEKLPEINNFLFGAASIPAREIGGDYYDFFHLENGDLGICVADIVGKGIPAGLFMAMLKSILHTHLKPFSSPQKALEEVNRVLLKDPVINKFVPVFYAILDAKTHTLRYCNAGHEPAILFSNGSTTTLETGGFPLGAIDDPGFEEKSIILEANDVVMILTDGAIEARIEDGSTFGYSKLIENVESHLHHGPQDLVDELLTELQLRSPDKGQHDDITIVALKSVQNYDHTIKQPTTIKDITVTSAKENVKIIRKMVENICSSMGFSEREVFDMKLAINEAHANVIEHAYFGSDKGEIYFKFMIYQDRLDILIKDFGSILDQKTIKGEPKHLPELEGSGLGLFLINNIMDEVEYNRKTNGTELFLSKRLKKEEK